MKNKAHTFLRKVIFKKSPHIFGASGFSANQQNFAMNLLMFCKKKPKKKLASAKIELKKKKENMFCIENVSTVAKHYSKHTSKLKISNLITVVILASATCSISMLRLQQQQLILSGKLLRLWIKIGYIFICAAFQLKHGAASWSESVSSDQHPVHQLAQ